MLTLCNIIKTRILRTRPSFLGPGERGKIYKGSLQKLVQTEVLQPEMEQYGVRVEMHHTLHTKPERAI